MVRRNTMASGNDGMVSCGNMHDTMAFTEATNRALFSEDLNPRLKGSLNASRRCPCWTPLTAEQNSVHLITAL